MRIVAMYRGSQDRSERLDVYELGRNRHQVTFVTKTRRGVSPVTDAPFPEILEKIEAEGWVPVENFVDVKPRDYVGEMAARRGGMREGNINPYAWLPRPRRF